MASIQEIQARVAAYGVTRPNRYQVELSTPPGLQPLIPPIMKERLAIQCEVAQLPGKSYSTAEQRIYGPIRKFPYTATYSGSLDLTFRVGADYRERSLFDEWHNLIMDTTTNMFGYYREYATDMIIHQFDHEDKAIYSIKLLEAWPVAIQPIELAAGSTNTYNRQTITFTFRRWIQVDAIPLVFQSTVTERKAEGNKVVTVLKQAGFAFFDQLPLITGSGGTLFGSTL